MKIIFEIKPVKNNVVIVIPNLINVEIINEVNDVAE